MYFAFTIEIDNVFVQQLSGPEVLKTNSQITDFIGDVYVAAEKAVQNGRELTPLQEFIHEVGTTLGLVEVAQLSADLSVPVELAYTLVTESWAYGQPLDDMSIYDFIPEFINLALSQGCFEISSLGVIVRLSSETTDSIAEVIYNRHNDDEQGD